MENPESVTPFSWQTGAAKDDLGVTLETGFSTETELQNGFGFKNTALALFAQIPSS